MAKTTPKPKVKGGVCSTEVLLEGQESSSFSKAGSKVMLTRKQILEAYSVSDTSVAIPLSQVEVVIQENASAKFGFEVGQLRSVKLTGGTFAEGYVNGGAWDPSFAGIVYRLVQKSRAEEEGLVCRRLPNVGDVE